jgi:hypothetical protein
MEPFDTTITENNILKADGTVPRVAQYYAQTDRKVRDARVDSFQESPKLDQDGNVIAGKLRFETPPDILVGTIETLGVGPTLHHGTIVIHLKP